MTAEEASGRLTAQLARILDAIRREPTDTNPRTYAVGARCPECCGRGWEPGPTIPDCLYPPTVDCEACGGTGKVGGRRDELAARRRAATDTSPILDSTPTSEQNTTVTDRHAHQPHQPHPDRRVEEVLVALAGLRVPLGASVRQCRMVLAEAGVPASQDVVNQACRVRNPPHEPQPTQPELPLTVTDRHAHQPHQSHGSTPTSPAPPVNRTNAASKPPPTRGVAPRSLRPG